jgi:hypothetical protein
MARHANGRVDAPLTVAELCHFSEMATQHITIANGGDLSLSGMASAGLDVRAGRRARASGMLGGLLRCAGEVELTGMLDGRILVEPGGSVA